MRAVRGRGIAADIVLVDAHVGDYADKGIVERLCADMIAPALAQGYTQVRLVGISIGAFGAPIYVEAQPQVIAGIAVRGPYLGKRELSEEIDAKGGLRSWRAPVGKLDPDDIDTIVWRRLQADAATRPELFLGYGRDDRFAFSDKLLAATLPADRVFTAPGGHDWAPWRAIWNEMLGRMPLKREAGCVSKP